MSGELERDIRVYSAMTEHVAEFDDWMEVENVLTWRDAIHDKMAADSRLSEELKLMLAVADERLATAAAAISRRFRVVFEESGAIPKERWWWHLDEGPQVREEAEKARREA